MVIVKFERTYGTPIIGDELSQISTRVNLFGRLWWRISFFKAYSRIYLSCLISWWVFGLKI